MTDHFPLPDDELASAYLDGAVDADERARVESDPDLLARADRLAGIRRAVAATRPVPDPDLRDQHITRALDLVGTVAPISLADRRDRRLRRHLAVLSAAAAIVVVAGVLALTANRHQRDSRSVTAGGASATTAAGAAEAAGGSKNDTAAPTTTAAAAVTTAAGAAYSTTVAAVSAPASPDLGPLDANSAPAALSGAAERVGDRALQPPPSCPAPSGTRYVGTGTYAGAPVYAFVTAPDAAEQRGVLLDTATCVVVADLRLT